MQENDGKNNHSKANQNNKNVNFESFGEDDILKKYSNGFLDAKGKVGQPAQQLKMTKFLPNAIYTITSGDWEPLSEYIWHILYYSLVYNSTNYSSYFNIMLDALDSTKKRKIVALKNMNKVQI